MNLRQGEFQSAKALERCFHVFPSLSHLGAWLEELDEEGGVQSTSVVSE